MAEKNKVVKQKTAELVVPNEQQSFTDVYFILQQAREKAYNSANGIMTYAYWNIGRRIIEQEQYGEKKAQYSSYLIRNLSKQLSDEFGMGFSREDDNPTIGTIFCTDKDETIVKYSVLHESQQIFASKYMTVLPTVEELQRELKRNQLIYEYE